MSILEEMKEEGQGREFLFTDKNREFLKYNAIQSSLIIGFKALNLPRRSNTYLNAFLCNKSFNDYTEYLSRSGYPGTYDKPYDREVCL